MWEDNGKKMKEAERETYKIHSEKITQRDPRRTKDRIQYPTKEYVYGEAPQRFAESEEEKHLQFH